MPVIFRAVLLLTLSNIFMTFAWYGHLKTLNNQKWYIAALVSWSIAFFEYVLQVPANRMGYTQLSVSQMNYLAASCEVSNPRLHTAMAPPVWRGGCSCIVCMSCMHANLRTTPTGRLGDAVAYRLFHCLAA